MGDRMTGSRAMHFSQQYRLGGDHLAAKRLHECGVALLHWEREAKRWEAEDAARRGMPELARPWVTLYPDNECGSCHATREEAVAVAKDHGARAIRLAVVEVAEPEAVKPTRAQGPSGWWYRPNDAVTVVQSRDGGATWVSYQPNSSMIPPADRALVARLLGERVGDA